MTDFLYPFLEREERDPGVLLDDLVRSAEAKARASEELRAATLAVLDAPLDAAARGMAERLAAGGRVLTFGNGGSATDAAGIAALFVDPPAGRPLPVLSLVDDTAVVTALANDVGFELAFSRQLGSLAGPTDIALGVSTSGSSPNLLRAFAEGRRLGLLNVALAGYDGGRVALAGTVDHCLVVRSDSVHRIQEVERAVVYELWIRVQRRLGGLPDAG